MRFLAISTNSTSVSELVDSEFARIDELRASGTLSAGWLKSDLTGAVLVLECGNRDEAIAALDTLPTVIHQATNFTLTEIVDVDSLR